MKQIFLLVDYKGNFGARYDASPYRSGMDRGLLSKYFAEHDYKAEYIPFSAVDIQDKKWGKTPVLYNSQEDMNGCYKNYIEDVVYALELCGANLIPTYKYLRAHHNKVFMELLTGIYFQGAQVLKTYHFGTTEELTDHADEFGYPVVIKGYSGAMSKNVFLANNREELIRLAKKVSSTKNLRHDLKERVRVAKYKGYIAESKYRSKFVLQEFIAGLENDWKVLIFGKRYYVFRRPNRKNDFRASGSGNKNYDYAITPPDGMFDLAKHYKDVMDVPFLSLDILHDGCNFYISEFQVINFGTVGHLKSDGYFVQKQNEWVKIGERLSIEQVYAESITDFIKGD